MHAHTTRACMLACTHTRTHARTRARTHAQLYTCGYLTSPVITRRRTQRVSGSGEREYMCEQCAGLRVNGRPRRGAVNGR